jgi:LysR family hydrogen peroxide-inducible transcriptional activator
MNLQQFEYILALDQHKNFSKAAEACFITQATLSTMVKRLEEELGVVIFDRKTNQILTTDSGKEIIQEAKKIIEHTSKIKEMASIVNQKIEGEITIGIIPTISSSLLHRLLPIILSKYPNLHFNIEELTTKTIVHQLKSGLLDVGIISTPIEQTDIEGMVLFYEKLMVYGLINSDRKYLIPEDLTNHHNFWLLKEGHCLREQIINLCELEPNSIKKNLSFQPNTFDSLLNLVDTFGGLTLLPQLFYNDLPPERKEKVTPFSPPYPVREVSIVYHRPFVKQKVIKMLFDEIKLMINKELEIEEISDIVVTKI